MKIETLKALGYRPRAPVQIDEFADPVKREQWICEKGLAVFSLMIEKSDEAHLTWERGWEGHEKAQLLRMARLSFEKKIRWLEETQDLIQALQRGKVLQVRNTKP